MSCWCFSFRFGLRPCVASRFEADFDLPEAPKRRSRRCEPGGDMVDASMLAASRPPRFLVPSTATDRFSNLCLDHDEPFQIQRRLLQGAQLSGVRKASSKKRKVLVLGRNRSMCSSLTRRDDNVGRGSAYSGGLPCNGVGDSALF